MVVLDQPSMETVIRNSGEEMMSRSGSGRVMHTISWELQLEYIYVKTETLLYACV